VKKFVLFVFNGDEICFIHVLLNALDMKQRGDDPAIVVEGAATKLIPSLAASDHPLHPLWEKCRSRNLVAGVCEACSRKMGTLDAAKAQGLTLLNDMNGHPGMAGFRARGYEIVTF
jgi:hypothetical protein